uniref:DNA-directed DNA polymerase n=1 Tax=viral metagenome TaxID=1070528 RepID=A0A6C0AS86_9ZZZZ
MIKQPEIMTTAVKKIKPTIVKSFRLFDFHVYDGTIDETGDGSGSDENSNPNPEDQQFIIQMFGVNEKGETCSLFVNDYQPFFFVKVGDSWSKIQESLFIDDLKSKVSKQFRGSIVSHELIDRHKLYGFTGSKTSKFVKIVFQNQASMRKYKNLWYNYIEEIADAGETKSSKKLKKVKFDGTYVELYESNIPPLLRYFHLHKISPSGWVSFKVGRVIKADPKTTTCTYEYICSLSDLIPLPTKETRVPYKICSFDIEASSSHGDFPLPIKTYKNLAKNLVDIFLKQSQFLDTKNAAILLKRVILTAFKYDDFDDVDVVYPKRTLSKEQIVTLIQILHERSVDDAKKANSEEDKSHLLTIDAIFDKIKNDTPLSNDAVVGSDECTEDSGETSFEYTRSNSKKTPKINEKISTVIDILMNMAYDRDEKIQIVNDVLTTLFPQLEGDKVTVIGSTFLRYGETLPYFNHCLVLGTCDPVDNVTIESVETEKELLLRWAALIQQENPDIIIGYNIFGFDYEFMFRRSQELACEREFLLLSRKIGDVCLNDVRDPKTDKMTTSIECSKLAIASGEYDLRYFKMQGRLQIDMYAYFRRDFNLSSYKLDDVAGEFISDEVKAIVCSEHPIFGSVTELHSKNLMGLHVGDFIHIEISSFTSNYYKNGQKFKVLAIGQGEGVNIITIAGHEQIDTKKPVKWTMAKDDITPQDIFRLADRDSSGRAIVAKYCIQDCNLVHHLMNKIDVLTGYIEMANICSVPISFLVFRGQGIKLTSFVAKKCMEKDTLMPDIEKTGDAEGYEGAIVLPPKCGMYMDNPVACVDYSSLYPSSMISQNYSHDSKVWSKEYDLDGKLIAVTGERNRAGVFIYDNLPGYHYIDMEFDTFKYIRKTPTSRAEKTKVGTMICRWAQFPDNKKGIMPAILEELLKARSDTRKMIKTESDPFMQNILDKRQLGYKVTANSLYGQCGSRTSTFYEKDVAAATTATGRQMIIYAKTMIEEVYKDRVHQLQTGESIRTKAEYIYGDSVANYTPVYVKVGDVFGICTIEDLANRYGNSSWTVCSEEGKQDKEVCELVGVETWTDKGWTKLYRVIRHQLASHKRMVRVLTHTGLVDVTDDHSLILSNGQEISPKDVVVGTELLHHSLPNIYFEKYSEKKISSDRTRYYFDNMLDAAICYYYLTSYNSYNLYTISYDNDDDDDDDHENNSNNKLSICIRMIPKNANMAELEKSKTWNDPFPEIFAAKLRENGKTIPTPEERKQSILKTTRREETFIENRNKIISIEEIPYQGYVYDLTTDNHHFAAGIGNMVVHNTDSVFFTFNLENPETGDKIVGKPALEMTIELAQEAAKLCSQWLKHPMELSYEKTLMPFILLSKKRYVGMLYETNPNKGKMKFMGLSIKRRDSCDYLKDVYGGILNMLMDTSSTNSIKSAIEFLNKSMVDLIEGRIPMDKLMITKALRGYYKNPNSIGHNVLANRIGKRDPGNKPKPGDRMKFVFIVNQNPKALMGDKIETPEFIVENKLQVDYNHYITNQLMKPLQQLFGLALIQIWECQGKTKTVVKNYLSDMDKLTLEYPDLEQFMKMKEKYCSKKVKALLFDKILTRIANEKNGMQPISNFFGRV